MAKQISQKMFDEVVRENMSEFDMDAAEAMEDAIQQFKAQGVTLGLIVQDPSLYTADGSDNGTSEHLVVTLVTDIREALNGDDREKLKTCLGTFREQCELDLARRCLAGKAGAYSVICECCRHHQAECTILVPCLKAACALCEGQPDLLDLPGIELLSALLQTYKHDHTVLVPLIRLIRLNCIKHEENRQTFVSQDLVKQLLLVLDTHMNRRQVVVEVCILLRVLTTDDDVRVPFGKGHEHAKLIVSEQSCLSRLMEISKVYTSDCSVLAELLFTLSCLAVRNEFCQDILDLGGLDLVLNVLQTNLSHQPVTKQILGLLKTLGGNDDVKVSIATAGGLEMILVAMTKHARHAGIASAGCGAIASISLRQPDHCRIVIDAGGAEVIAIAMGLHPTDVQVQKMACLAIRNLVGRTSEYCKVFLDLGGESLIRDAWGQHADCGAFAKAALCDLGCKVTLKELWTGEGQQLAAD